MRNALLLILVAALLPTAVSAQDVPSNWEFDMIFPNDSTSIIHTDFGVQGLEVDNQGRVWIQSHYARSVGTETNRAQIRVFEEDGTEVDFSPIWTVTINDSTYTWANTQGRGLRLDADGHILASFANNLFRINSETGEGVDVLHTGLGPLTSVGTSDDGYVMVTAVLNERPIQLYFDDIASLVTLVTDDRPGIARSAEMSADGRYVYVPIIGETGGRVLTYFSEDGAFGTYAPVDPIVRGVHGETTAISRATDILWVSGGNPADGINVDAGEPTGTNFQFGNWYGFDTETGDVVDRITWHNFEVDQARSNGVRPRGTAFSPDGQYAYIAQFVGNGAAGVQRFRYNPTTSNVPEIIPASFELTQNYPNPFNPTTTINYTVREAGQVALKVYDMLGREVATLHNGVLAPGEYNATFDARHLSSGTYLYVLEAGGQRITRSMVLLK
jgi:hypothetical protein